MRSARAGWRPGPDRRPGLPGGSGVRRLGAGEREGDRQAAQGGDQVQAQPPEVARMAGATPVFGPSGQVRAAGGIAGAAAFDRGGIDDPRVVGPQAGIGGEQPDQGRDQPGRGAQPPVVPRLARQVAEQMPQVRTGTAQPAGLQGVSQQRLHDRQGDQLGVAEPGLQADGWPPRRQAGMLLQQVISSHIECGREGVYVVRHTMSLFILILGSAWLRPDHGRRVGLGGSEAPGRCSDRPRSASATEGLQCFSTPPGQVLSVL